MTISRCAFSPTRPPPSYQRSPVVPTSSSLPVPEDTLVTARSGSAMPSSVGGGKSRSAHGPSGGVGSTTPNCRPLENLGKPAQAPRTFAGNGGCEQQGCRLARNRAEGGSWQEF